MVDLEEQMDNTDQMLISTKCINGHKFKVPKEKIQASSSGKSFVTLCPKCNKVARLRKEEVFQSFGVNPRDHVAVGNLFASLSNQSPSPTSTASIPVNGSALQDAARKNGALVTNASVPEEEEDDDEDDDEDDEDAGEKEYTAQVETADDITGKQKKIQRFRTVSDEEDTEDDEEDDDDEYERTPVKNKKQTKKTRPRVRDVVQEDDDDDDDEDDEDDRRGSKRKRKTTRRSVAEDEPVDPNEILKDVIEESGVDETSMSRIFDYIDLQPDGWQPAAIQGVIQMYISPAAAAKIAQRYQAELYKEDKRRERERYLMNMVGTPAGNMRLNNTGATNIPPFNNPLSRGAPPIGAPYPGGYPQRGDPYAPRGDPYAPQYQDPHYPDPRYNDPRMQSQAVPLRREAPAMSPFQVKQMISEELEARFEKLQTALTATKREDTLQNELAQMRALVFDVLKQRPTESGAGSQKTDPLLASLLTNQSDLNKTLLMNTLDKSNKEDPMQKILIQELMELKKVRSAPPLTHTTEELTQRIQLQKLANDLELAQADFRDKAEGRAFARDLAGQALTKIGESFATAYLETQRTAAMQATQVQSSGLTPPPRAQAEPQKAVRVENVQEPKPQIESSAQPRAIESDDSETQRDVEKYHVKGVTQSDGSLSIPCPTCGSDIIAYPGDTKISCGTCGSTFNAGAPPQNNSRETTEYTKEDTRDSDQEIVTEPARKPKVIL